MPFLWWNVLSFIPAPPLLATVRRSSPPPSPTSLPPPSHTDPSHISLPAGCPASAPVTFDVPPPPTLPRRTSALCYIHMFTVQRYTWAGYISGPYPPPPRPPTPLQLVLFTSNVWHHCFPSFLGESVIIQTKKQLPINYRYEPSWRSWWARGFDGSSEI